MTATTHLKILYVDDDSDDRFLLNESLIDTGADADLVCASDGEEAVKYLNSSDDASLPALIILDLNMPKWDGRKTLNYIKQDPHLSAIPVVILSTSDSNAEKEACFQLGAVCYYRKPYDYKEYRDIINNFIPLMKVC